MFGLTCTSAPGYWTLSLQPAPLQAPCMTSCVRCVCQISFHTPAGVANYRVVRPTSMHVVYVYMHEL